MSATTLRCPRCASFLFLAPTDKAHLAGCGRCGGVFLGRASAQRVFEKLEAEVRTLAMTAAQSRTQNLEVSRSTPAGACPQCSAAMRLRRVEMAGISVDDCDAHGTWFDHDELRAWMDSVAQMRGHTIGKGAAPLVAAGVAAGAVGVAGAAAYAAYESDAAQEQVEDAVAENSDTFADGVVEGIADAADAVDAGSIFVEVMGSLFSSLFD